MNTLETKVLKVKKCTRCKRVHPVKSFNKSRSAKDGLQSWCVECCRQWHVDNRESINKRHRERYRENREAVLKHQKEYHHKNKSDPIYREKRRVAQQKRRERRMAWWNGIRASLSCEICGESRTPCLDFHHKDPSSKEFGFGKAVSHFMPRGKILKEIEKCVVLCANCHRMEHHNERIRDKGIKNNWGVG